LGGRKRIRPVKNMGGWRKWALVSPDEVAPSRMVSVSACVNLPLHHIVQKFFSGTGSPGWSRNKGRKMVVVVVGSVETHCRYQTKHKMVISKKEQEKCLNIFWHIFSWQDWGQSCVAFVTTPLFSCPEIGLTTMCVCLSVPRKVCGESDG